MSDPFELLDLAIDGAVNAHRAIANDICQYQKVEQDLDRDVKIAADKKLESSIIEHLIKETRFPILSEETGAVKKSSNNSKYHWIIDPLDGSLNFSRGIPISCVSIALWEGMEPLLGVVYDFNRNETFSGIVGEGAWLNKKPITVSNITEKSKAVLCTGFPVSTDFSRESIFEFSEKIREFKKVRLLGSAALSLAYVACGRADIYFENDIKIWDVAAGLALVKAAGGAVKYSPTSKKNVLGVKASNKHLIS